MQTFLPFPDYDKSARVLDDRRLGKQRVECLQILKALTIPSYGWQNHPAVKMWRGWEIQLRCYAGCILDEWIIERGCSDTVEEQILDISKNFPAITSFKIYPDWLTEEFCRAHQSNLVRKDPEFYGPKFPDVPLDLPYIWPVK